MKVNKKEKHGMFQKNSCSVIAFPSIKGGSGSSTIIHKYIKWCSNGQKNSGRGIIIDLSGRGCYKYCFNLSGENTENNLILALGKIREAKLECDPSLFNGKVNKIIDLNYKWGVESYDLNRELPKYIEKVNKYIDIIDNQPGLGSTPMSVDYSYPYLPFLIDKLKGSYKFILIEMPSGYGVINKEILSKVNHLVVPFAMSDSYELIGRLSRLDQIVRELILDDVPISISGIVPMFYRKSSTLELGVLNVLRKIFQRLIWPAVPFSNGLGLSEKTALNLTSDSYAVIFDNLFKLANNIPPVRKLVTLKRGKLIYQVWDEIEDLLMSYSRIAIYLNQKHLGENLKKITKEQVRRTFESISIFKNYSRGDCEKSINDIWNSNSKGRRVRNKAL